MESFVIELKDKKKLIDAFKKKPMGVGALCPISFVPSSLDLAWPFDPFHMSV